MKYIKAQLIKRVDELLIEVGKDYQIPINYLSYNINQSHFPSGRAWIRWFIDQLK